MRKSKKIGKEKGIQKVLKRLSRDLLIDVKEVDLKDELIFINYLYQIASTELVKYKKEKAFTHFSFTFLTERDLRSDEPDESVLLTRKQIFQNLSKNMIYPYISVPVKKAKVKSEEVKKLKREFKIIVSSDACEKEDIEKYGFDVFPIKLSWNGRSVFENEIEKKDLSEISYYLGKGNVHTAATPYTDLERIVRRNLALYEKIIIVPIGEDYSSMLTSIDFLLSRMLLEDREKILVLRKPYLSSFINKLIAIKINEFCSSNSEFTLEMISSYSGEMIEEMEKKGQLFVFLLDLRILKKSRKVTGKMLRFPLWAIQKIGVKLMLEIAAKGKKFFSFYRESVIKRLNLLVKKNLKEDRMIIIAKSFFEVDFEKEFNVWISSWEKKDMLKVISLSPSVASHLGINSFMVAFMEKSYAKYF